MSTRGLMMIARENDLPGIKLGSLKDIWKRLRPQSKGVFLFRHFDAEPEEVKREITKGLNLVRKTMFNFGFDVGQVTGKSYY
jgi:hypothetical protein